MLASFIKSFTQQGTWFQEHFSLFADSNCKMLLNSEKTSNIKVKGSLLLSLVASQDFSLAMPRNAEELILSFSKVTQSLSKEKSYIYVFSLIEIAKICQSHAETGFENIFSSITESFLHNDTLDLPFHQICDQNNEEFRDSMLEQIQMLKRHFIDLKLFFAGKIQLAKPHTFYHITSLNHYMNIFSIFMATTFGETSNLSKQLKEVLIEFAQTVLDSFLEFQSHQQLFEKMGDGISLKQATLIIGIESWGQSDHLDDVGIGEINCMYVAFNFF